MLDCPWKTIPKWPLTLWIPYTVLKNMKMSFSISYDVYIDLTIGLALKNYPKMTLDTLKSVHWIKSWENVFIFVSWYVQWPHHRNGLEKLPQNDSPLVKIHPLDQKLWRCLFSCQLICKVTSPLDWPWKTTPKRPLMCLNLSIGSKVTERSFSMSADVYSDFTIGSALKNYPKRTLHMLESVHWFQSYGEVFFHVSWCVQWPHHWIGLEKLPQKDPSYA